jgi:amino acid transporter
MKAVFIAFVVTLTLLTAATGAVGGMVEGEHLFDLHFAVGLVTTFMTVLCHCVVFTYFMATQKMIEMAAADAGLEAAVAAEARRNKLRAMRVLLPALAAALMAAFAGAFATTHPGYDKLHLATALLSAAMQIGAWWVEFGLIVANGGLMNRVFDAHALRRSPGAPG